MLFDPTGCVRVLQTTASLAAANVASARGQQIDGLVTVSAVRGDSRWMQFKDHDGRTAGSIEMNEAGGAYLNSTAGDLAEWHPRLSAERDLEEGDVVGLCDPPPGAKYANRSHITLKTQGATQLGVISRRAMMTGSYPGSDAEQEFDTVAYCGRVPVKVIGEARAGDYLVPSGKEDGTAVAKSGPSAVKIAQVERSAADPSLPDKCVELEMLSVQPPKHTDNQQQWHYVDADVFAPNFSVTPVAWHERLHKGTLLLLTMACVCVIARLASLFWTGSTPSCNPVQLDHGTLQGVCDGKSGSSCRYSSCDEGYRMHTQPTDDGCDFAELSSQAARPPGGALAMANLPANAWLRQFPPCSTCFGTDGLMCEPGGRTFPLPLPEYWPEHTAKTFTTFRAEYLYHCSSTPDDLTTCEESGGTLCYGKCSASVAGINELLLLKLNRACCCTGPYSGIRPCESCASTGPSAAGYQPEGMACEATDRELLPAGESFAASERPNLTRRVDNRRCVSGLHKYAGSKELKDFAFPEPWCSTRAWNMRGISMPDDDNDLYLQVGLCVPLDQQSTAKARLINSSKSFGELDVRRASSYQTSAAAAAAGPQAQQRRNVSAGLVRHCREGNNKESGDYDGQTMRCVRQYCPPETLGLLRLAACDLCDGKEPLMHFSQ